jgi:uncharacterized RDD family membrane protein YckC
MNITVLRRLSAALVLLCAATLIHAESAAPAAGPSEHAASSAPTPADDREQHIDEPGSRDRHDRFDRHHRLERRARHDGDGRRDNNLVSIGHDSKLAAGEQASSVVSILGSSTSEGDAVDVVSILGNTRVSGPVEDSAVSVLGNTYVDSKVDGDVVAVIGSVELGPHAEINGDVVAVLGAVRRDPAAIVHGNVQDIIAGEFGDTSWLHTWIRHCLLYGRPLALVPGLGWAWGMALGFLAFYALLAVLFRESISRCVQTFETHPGQTLLAAIIAMLLSPVLIVLLCVTLIGIAAVPFVVVLLLCAGLFGKAVILAWLGGRITSRHAAGPLGHPALAVLIGGAVVLACYLVPVLGFLVYKLLGILGFGAVVYTLILAARAHQAAKGQQVNGATAAFGGGAPSPDSAASTKGTASVNGTASAGGAAPASGTASVSGPTAPADTVPPPSGPPPGTPGTPPLAAAAPLHVTASMPRAGFWHRMAALFLDVLLVGFATSVLQHHSHIHLLVLAIYGAVMWKLRGSTVGGIVFDLKVVRLDGRPVDWETAIVRALGCFLSLAVAGLGFIWIAFDDANQAWHDKIAGTVVVRVPKGVPPPV